MDIDFKPDFLWGAATSSYQIEGSAYIDGKGESIWDRFCKVDGAIEDGSNGDIACDHYERFEDDIEIMSELHLEAYRFSISWPRILPNGSGDIEQKGLDFYRKLIDKLIEKNIEPIITLYHWDLPQVLEDKGGWARREISDEFEAYTKILVEAFGDSVKKWCTINEPMVVCMLGYYLGIHAPGKQDEALFFKSIHNVNLSHAKAYKVLKEYNSAFQVGTAQALFANYANDSSDKALIEAVQNENDKMMWIYLDPVTKGTYPESYVDKIIEYNGDIVREDLTMIKDTSDFIGVNIYSRITLGYNEDGSIDRVMPVDAERTSIGWEVFPEAMYDMMIHLKDNYDNRPIYITENGAAYDYPVVDGTVDDIKRVEYFKSYIAAMNRAINEGANVRGYFAWSLMDNFEWAYGYSQRFGIVHVDYATQKRTIKNSGYFYADVIKNSGYNL